MSDYFEKLGNLLNEALETGEIPQENKEISEEPEKNNNKVNDFSQDIRKNNYNYKDFIQNKEELKTGEVIKESHDSIKMYNYAKIMHITPEIQSALTTLDIVYPYTSAQLNKKYHDLLKLIHPDTSKNTIQDSDTVYKNRQLPTINQLQDAYLILKEYCV